ncbi:MAG: Na(+)/H(+) antiporter subunit C [Bacilli bacterium]|nr:Na(+)/H(+) antiporter subunit C [Bacilli bacterium]
METLIIIVIGVLITSATYLLLSDQILHIILGSGVLTHAVHLLLMAMGGFKGASEPIIGHEQTTYVDALPQALILTSIVINFAITAFFLVLAYHIYQSSNTTDLRNLRGYRHE